MKETAFRTYLLCLVIIFSATAAEAQNQRPLRRNDGMQQVQSLTSAQEQEVLEYLKQQFPERLERLEDIEDNRPFLYRRTLARLYREMQTLKRVKDNDPERYEELLQERRLEVESLELAQQYKETEDESEKQKIKTRLQKLLYEIFDYRQLNRQKEIERLEKRLAELKEQNDRRQEMKEEIVERRLLQLTGQESVLEW